MADKLRSKKKYSQDSILLAIGKGILYALMLLLVLLFFEGNGQFLYEM